ncbi:MAG: hypothetical protein IPK87_11695 [Planctomycetes bacterium]|nr:hypothetical protein [Planctomycetota bacterium]
MRTVLLLAVLAGPCAAQGITPTAQDFGRGGQPTRATYSFGLEADVIDKDDAVRWQRGDAQVNAPLLLGEKFKLFAFAGATYFGLDNRRNTLPPRLVKSSLGLFSIANIDDMQLTLGTTAGYQGDGDHMTWDTLDFTLTAVLKIPLDDEWSVSPGFRFSTGVSRLGRGFRYIPFPSLSFTYRPHADLEVTLGIGDFAVKWRQSQWLTIEAGYFPLFNARLRFAHEVTPWFTVSEYIGRYDETYALTNKRWPDDHVIYLNSWSTGVTLDFHHQFGEGPRGPVLGAALTWGLGFGGKARVWDYRESQERFELKLKPSQNFAITAYLKF